MCKSILAAIAAVLISGSALADDYVVNVHGIVCSFCAQGLTKKISKLSFVDQSKYIKGVKVEIEKQRVTVAVKADQELDVDALFAAIESGGYEPIDIWSVDAKGVPDAPLEEAK